MTKRKTILFVIIFIIVAALALYFLVFNKRNQVVLNAMPDDVLCFFDVKANNDFSVMLNNDPIFKALGETQLIGELQKDLNQYISLLATEPTLLSDLLQNNLIAGAFAAGQTEADYLILLPLDKAKRYNLSDLHPELNGTAPTVKTHVFERLTIYELNYADSIGKLTCAMSNGIFMYSTSSVLVENAILQLKKGTSVTDNHSFTDVYNELHDQTGYTWFVNVPQFTDYLSLFAGNESASKIMQLKKYAAWIGLRPEVKGNGIVFNGYASASNNGEALLLNSFTGQFATDMNNSVPGNTVVLYRINSAQLTENIATKFTGEIGNKDYFDYWAPWITESLLVGFGESLDQQFMNRAFVIIPASDRKLAESKIKYAVETDTFEYRNYKIMELNCGAIMSKISGLQIPEICYGTWSDNNLIITIDKSELTNIIDGIENKATLSGSEDYNAFKQEISASFNNSIYIDLSKSGQIIKSFISDKHAKSVEANFGLLQQFSNLELQFSESKGLYLVNGFLQYNAAPTRKSGLLWNASMDADIVAGPYVVFNPNANQEQIIVQDSLFQLYLISPNGDVNWKKQYTSKILSSVHEVDFYGNGKIQYLFNTENGIHLIDVNGDVVEGFPISLTTTITNPITVFKNTANDYTMYVACANGNIYGYYKDGKPISGWNPLKGAGKIDLPLVSFATDQGKGIGFVNEAGFQLRKLNGNSQLSIKQADKIIGLSKAEANLFMLTAQGDLITLSSNLKYTGNQLSDSLLMGKITSTSEMDSVGLLFLEDGYIKGKTYLGNNAFIIEPDTSFVALAGTSFGGYNYWGYSNSKGQLFLYDQHGDILPGFPVRGSNMATIQDLARSGDKMLITVDGNTLLAYRIQ